MSRKILYFITEDWFFNSHFLDRAVAASKSGLEVVVLANKNEVIDNPNIKNIRFVDLNMDRKSTNILNEIKVLLRIRSIYKVEKPDIVHHVALKPMLYGSVISRLVGIKNIINAPVGMGYAFSSNDFFAKLLKPIIIMLFQLCLPKKNSSMIFENKEDLDFFVDKKIVNSNNAFLIKGAGVDIEYFKPVSERPSPIVVVLIARMLKDKGIREFVEAARILTNKGLNASFCLVGGSDEGNFSSISKDKLNEWHDEGIVNYTGYSKDIRSILEKSHIVCLPSYREGLPKSLLEGIAMAKPIVATDVTGCREVVIDSFNGLLVPARNSIALSESLEKLILNSKLRKSYGYNGRQRAEKEFSSDIVIKKTLSVYYQNPHQ
jgi:glycosyltransferase involved in cell wall biosynthesis